MTMTQDSGAPRGAARQDGGQPRGADVAVDPAIYTHPSTSTYLSVRYSLFGK